MREVLPNRRISETFKFQAGVPGYSKGSYIATIGYYPDFRPGEVFIHSSKSGSDRDLILQEAAISLSFALQHGCTMESIRTAMPRATDGQPESVIGTLLDLLIAQKKKVAA